MTQDRGIIVVNNGFGQDAEIYSVSELNRAAKSLLEGQFPAVFVEGEISHFSRPASGHWYFTLKDDAGRHAPRCSGIAIQGLTSRQSTA